MAVAHPTSSDLQRPRRASGKEDIMQSILRTSHELMTITSASQPVTTNEEGHCSPCVSLPDPPSLLPSLHAVCSDPHVISKINELYRSRAYELRKRSEIAIGHACREHDRNSPLYQGSAKLEARIMMVFSQVYMTRLYGWIEEIITLLQNDGTHSARRVDTNISASASHVPAFNQVYVPLLEHYFEENPFPSRADKIFLARKSGMAYRQIHVWFQNRRNRTKREGKVLRKKPMAEGASLPFDNLYKRMHNFMSPHRSAPIDLDLDVEIPRKHHYMEPRSPNPLDRAAPLHAFPTTYPPLCGYDPFTTTEDVFRLQVSHWPRQRASSARPNPKLPIDLDELSERFSSVNVRDDSCNRLRKSRSKSDGRSAISSITIVTCPAPHPALIAQRPVPACPLTPFPTVRCSSSRTHVFRPPGPNIPLCTLLSASAVSKHSDDVVGRRKISPLPRRARFASRGFTPTFSESSLSPGSTTCSPSASSDSFQDYWFSGSSPCSSPEALSVSPPIRPDFFATTTSEHSANLTYPC